MAGELTGFNPDTFRTNITATMVMGLSNDTELQPTFFFRSASTYPVGTVLDPEGRPIDPRVTPTLTPAFPPLKVPCAVEYMPDTTNNEGLAGTFWSNRAVLTMLDVQYAQVAEAIEVDLDGRRYLIQQMTSVGLGLVTVYMLQCYAKGTGDS